VDERHKFLLVICHCVTDTVDWDTDLPHKRPVPLLSKGSLPKQVEEEHRGGTGRPRFTWKTAVKTQVMMTVLTRLLRHQLRDFVGLAYS